MGVSDLRGWKERLSILRRRLFLYLRRYCGASGKAGSAFSVIGVGRCGGVGAKLSAYSDFPSDGKGPYERSFRPNDHQLFIIGVPTSPMLLLLLSLRWYD